MFEMIYLFLFHLHFQAGKNLKVEENVCSLPITFPVTNGDS